MVLRALPRSGTVPVPLGPRQWALCLSRPGSLPRSMHPVPLQTHIGPTVKNSATGLYLNIMCCCIAWKNTP